ncbi:MAG: hypothetical protein M0C28_03840 [Candidatus Moduliflexus flocculans]|nr:hypothetical protein [Candidatus Moduliflexus flocculans]
MMVRSQYSVGAEDLDALELPLGHGGLHRLHRPLRPGLVPDGAADQGDRHPQGHGRLRLGPDDGPGPRVPALGRRGGRRGRPRRLLGRADDPGRVRLSGAGRAGLFALAALAMLALAALTVGTQTLRAARANPVDSLRYE